MRVFVAGLVLGVLALQHAAELPTLPGAHILLAGVTAAVASTLLPRQAFLPRLAATFITGFLCGYGWAAWRAEIRLADALPLALEGRDVEVTGIVAGLPRVDAQGTRFVFHREAGAGIPPVVSLSWYPERLKGGTALPPKLVPGERWRFTVRLKRPRGLANPHAFRLEPWALERGIRAVGYVRPSPAPQRLDARVDGWPFTLHRLRSEVRDRMREHLGGARLAGVLVALAIGDQDAIAAADWDTFWRTGVGHLMSISGLHITMIAALVYGLAAFAWARLPRLPLLVPARKAAVALGFAAALAYALMTGFQVPAQRTTCMLAAIALCVLLGRHGSPSRALASAALAVVAADPWAVASGPFWLSFGAVAAIFYFASLRAGAGGRLRAALREQAAVSVIMVPMLAALFQQVSIVSPLANAFAIPLVSLGVVPLTLAGAFLPLPVLLDAAHLLLLGTMHLLEALAAWPGAMHESHAPAPWTVVAAAAGCAWLLAPRGVPLRSCGLLWIAPMFLVAPARPAHGEAWIDVLDVGNGLAAVVRTAGAALAYDAGPAWNEEADSGNRIVVPYLRGEGIRRLDGLVVSHADDDHAGGARSVATLRRPSWLLSPLADGHPLHGAVGRSVRCQAGHGWTWDGVRFEVLHPAPGAPPKVKENDRSCVLRIASAGGAALLTGDIEARSEAQLLARDAAALSAEALVVPHHGSRSSSTPAFLDAVAPHVAIVSAGYRNRFGHPHPAVLARYATRGIRVHRTDLEGALRLVLPAESSGTPAVHPLAPPVRYWAERRRTP